jgi:hypothetical protein
MFWFLKYFRWIKSIKNYILTRNIKICAEKVIVNQVFEWIGVSVAENWSKTPKIVIATGHTGRRFPSRADTHKQGDQMSFGENRPKCCPTIVSSKLIRNYYPGKSSPKFCKHVNNHPVGKKSPDLVALFTCDLGQVTRLAQQKKFWTVSFSWASRSRGVSSVSKTRKCDPSFRKQWHESKWSTSKRSGVSSLLSSDDNFNSVHICS